MPGRTFKKAKGQKKKSQQEKIHEMQFLSDSSSDHEVRTEERRGKRLSVFRLALCFLGRGGWGGRTEWEDTCLGVSWVPSENDVPYGCTNSEPVVNMLAKSTLPFAKHVWSADNAFSSSRH